MFKKLCSLIILLSLLYSDIAYPLSNRSPFQSEKFRQFVSAFASGEVTEDRSGTWLVGEDWKIRFYKKGRKIVRPKLDSGYELIYEEDLSNRLSAQVYFKGLSKRDRDEIIEFLRRDKEVSALARMVLGEVTGTATGKAVRREISRETAQKLEEFLDRLGPQLSDDDTVSAVAREINREAGKDIKDYLLVFKRRRLLKEKIGAVGQDLFILKKISELAEDENYKTVMELFTKAIEIRKGGRIIIKPPETFARIGSRAEAVSERDIDPLSTISFTWGNTVYFNEDSRFLDFIVYFLHEIVHLAGGKEQDARIADKEVLAILKGIIKLLRESKGDAEKGRLLNDIADVMEYEVLGYELDLHTAKLEVSESESGKIFLTHFGLAGINIMPPNRAYVKAMTRNISGIIREKEDKELFSEIRRIVETGNENEIRTGIFLAFTRYIKGLAEKRMQESKKLSEDEEPEPLTSEYELNVLAYTITMKEAERRLKEVVLNKDAPLFARVNDAIMIDMFGESEKVEFNAVERIRKIMDREPVKALQILEELRNKKSVELISEFLSEKYSRKTRATAAERLFNIAMSLTSNSVFSSEETIKNLLNFINRPKIAEDDPDLNAVLQIVTVLSCIKCRDAIPILLDIMEQNESYKIKKFVAGALGSIGDTSIIPKLKKRVWEKGDINNMRLCIFCLEELPNDEGAGIIIDTFQKTNNKDLKLYCLKALMVVIKKKRISVNVMAPIIEPLMELIVSDKSKAGLNFVLGRIVSIAIQSGRMDLFKQINQDILGQWINFNKKIRNNALAFFAFGLIHDTFMDIKDLKGVDKDNPLKEILNIVLEKFVGNWIDAIEYLQKLKEDIYAGRKEYSDIIWKEIAIKLGEIKPNGKLIIGKQWFQRTCMGIAYRVLLDTWDIGRIEDRDYNLELMILRSSFVPDNELPEGAIGATEAFHGDYILLDDSLFSAPENVPNGVNTVWHEATHLLSITGIADIADVNLLGASSHNNIEFYLLSEIFGLPKMEDVVGGLRKGTKVEDLMKEYKKHNLSDDSISTIRAVLQGMAVRDRADGPQSAFFMVRNIKPSKVKKWEWHEVLRRLKKITVEMIDAYTIRKKQQTLVHTYLDGARFSGYAHRIGIETGYPPAANIYVELLVKYRMRPAQAEFVARTVARFMTEEKDILKGMENELIRRCKGVPQFKDVLLGEIDKWLKRCVVEKVKSLAIEKSGDAKMQISYDDLNKFISDKYKKIVREMEKERIQNSILNRVSSSIIARRRIFKAMRRRAKTSLKIAPIEDREGNPVLISWYVSSDSRYIIVEADFGSGNEVYGYIDTEKKEMRLVNSDNDRIDIDKISKALKMTLTINNLAQIEIRKEKKRIQWSLYLEFLRGLNWKRIWKHVSLGALGIVIFVFSSILNLSGIEIYMMVIAAILIVVELIIVRRLIVEDIEFKLPKELNKKLKENRIINKGIRKFLDDLYNGNLITGAEHLFLIGDFNRVLLAYDKEGLINFLNREFSIDSRVSCRIIDFALRVLEYKEKVDTSDLVSMTMLLYTEEIISDIANGNCIFWTEERKFKKIGIAEMLNYARKGKRELYRALCKSHKIWRFRKIPSFIAEDVTNIIYDIYLSMEKKDGEESLEKFAKKVVQLDFSDYITPPLARYKLIKGFKARGVKFLETEVSRSIKKDKRVDGKIFDAVIDALGIDMGLEFLRETRQETKNTDLFLSLWAYLDSFEIGPTGYIPVQILDAWGSFNLWKKRRGDFTYKDAQREFIRLYVKYIKDQKGSIPKWGWTFLWLGYYEKGTKMNDAVLDLLKLLLSGEDVNNAKISELCEKYKLGQVERERFKACMPIDGFIAMVSIYCRDIVWGRQNLAELEEGLRKNMNVVLDSDIAGEEIYNSEVDKWIYTFRNLSSNLKGKVKDNIRKEVIDLMLERIAESGMVIDKDAFRGELNKIFDLIFATRLPKNGERFVDCISIIGLCKVLFDYAKNMAKDGHKLRKSHFVKNKEVSKKEGARFKGKPKESILPSAFTGEEEKEFKEYSRNNLAEFYTELGNSKKLVIFTHRHTETMGLLYWIQNILRENPLLEVRIVPQKSLWELNSTKEDILSVLNDKEMGLQELSGFREKGRFIVLDDCADGFSWLNCPEKTWVKGELASNCVVLGAGWDNFVSMQGLNRSCYFAFGVDSEIKKELTGCEINEPVFVKTCGGIPATKIGDYNLREYLEGTNCSNYKTLLGYFGEDRIKLHEWIKIEAKRLDKKETDIIADNRYCEEPQEMFGKCALRNMYADIRVMAMDVILNNYGNEKFGIVKGENVNEVKIDGITIQIGKQADVYYLPKLQAAVIASNGKRLVFEVIKGEDDTNYLRIGDLVYGITKDTEINLNNLIMEPALWIGNSELVEFFSIDGKGGAVEKERGPPGVFLKDVPYKIIRKIPTALPQSIYKKAEGLLAESIECLPLRLHYVIVLLSSNDKNQCVKGFAELEKLRATGDRGIIKLIGERGVKRVGEWVLQEVPGVDRDIFHISNFTIEQERILRVLHGGYLLRPPLVEIPGQGVSVRFHNLVAGEMEGFGIDLRRGNRACGVGSVLLSGDRRHFISEGDSLLGLVDGLMPGAFRLNKDGSEIVQLPTNSSILNYLKAIHHLAHITSARLIESRGGEPDPLQEFTPSIEDILVIKYAERIAKELGDGFSNFKGEIVEADNEDKLKEVFARYGLNAPSGKDFNQIKEEIEKIGNMLDFSDYITKNDLGRFVSVKEFLNVLIDYKKDTMKDYIRQLPPTQQILLERLLSAKDSEEINGLLIVASFLAGCYIPKVDFSGNIEAVMELLSRQRMTPKLDRNEILNKIDNVLESGEPFSAKAVRIVGTMLFNIDLKIGGEERRRIEQGVMDILSGKWWQEIGESLEEEISKLEGAGVSAGDLREELRKIRTYRIGESRELGEVKPVDAKDVGVNIGNSWKDVIRIVEKNNIERVFFDIDKTTIDAVGFLTTTPWFREMTKEMGLAETIRVWREVEEKQIQGGFFHLMEDCIPDIIKELKDNGVKVYFYTARGEEDLERTKGILTSIGIDLKDIEIITSEGGTPELKRDALVEYYKKKGWFNGKKVPTLFMDDTLANVRTICSDNRFKHIRGLWYRPHYEKRYNVRVEEFLESGRRALEARKPMEALLWYMNAFYFRTRDDIANQVYDTVMQNIGFEPSIEDMFYAFINDRLRRYKSAVEREEVWVKPEPEEKEIKEPVQIEPAPDIPDSETLKGVKRIIVIGSHSHVDHIKGFLDYAKGEMKNIVETKAPKEGERRTGGAITHSLSNYWGRIDYETIVFDLGWFPEGFVDPLIQTINPRDKEIIFIMDPDTERTVGFEEQLTRLKLERVKLKVLDYGKIFEIPIENGKKILEIENSPAYHLEKEVGSSIYFLRVKDGKTKKVLHSIGYISELGDTFPEKMDKVLLKKLARLNQEIVDGTNLIAPMGREPLPLKDRPNRVHKYVDDLNNNRFLIFNIASARMNEDAAAAAENLDPNIPIIIIGGEDALKKLKRSYNVPKDGNYYTIGERKVYLVYDIAKFHRKLREEGLIPELDSVLEERKQGLIKAGWTDEEIDLFVSEWKENDNQEIREHKDLKGKVKGLEALLWDLRKTRAVVINSNQLEGDPTRKRYENYRSFWMLGSVVNKKDVSILIEGRPRTEGSGGSILRILLKEEGQRKIKSITGEKDVKATIDEQWRSGHITFENLMYLLNKIADKAIELGNVYNKRTFIPVPREEWLRLVKDEDKIRKFGREDIGSVIEIINKWNNNKVVTYEDMQFVRKVMKEIFENAEFFRTYLGIEDAEELKAELLERLERVEMESKLQGRANIRIFVASTSKFIDVLRKQILMDPQKKRELFNIVDRFIGFEVGVSHEAGVTIDLVRREKEEYSRDLRRELNRDYLKELYDLTIRGKIAPDLSRYHDKKGLDEYRAELGEIIEKAKARSKRQGKDLFIEWSDGLKRYIESQYLRIGLRHADKLAPHSELRKELTFLCDAVIEAVYAFSQEKMQNRYRDIAIIACGDYAEMKTLFKDGIVLGVMARKGVDAKYVEDLKSSMLDILNGIGIPVEFNKNWPLELYKRAVISYSKDIDERLKRPASRDVLSERERLVTRDLKTLGERKGFDIHEGPGGLDDIDLIRYFFSQDLTLEERRILDEAEEFLRRYKEEAGLSTGGEEDKAKALLSEIISNMGFPEGEEDFINMFYEKVFSVYTIFLRFLGKELQPGSSATRRMGTPPPIPAGIPSKGNRFSQLVCGKIKEKYNIDVSLDDLETDLQSLKMRLVPKLNGIQTVGLNLIDDISRIVMDSGLETGVSYDVMIKAVIIVASQILPKLAERSSIKLLPAEHITDEEIERLYEEIAKSV